MITLAEAKAIYRTGKGHFFDRETLKYWGSRIESALYKNRCFVTSENNFDGSRSSPRLAVSLKSGIIAIYTT